MESSLNSVITFLSLFCNWQCRTLYSIYFLYFQAHIPAGWHPETPPFAPHYCSLPRYTAKHFFIFTLQRPHGKHRLLLSRIVLGALTAPLHGNGHCVDHIDILLTRSYRGHLFNKSMPSNGYTRHNIYIYIYILIYIITVPRDAR
jgi:hypothetical protein